MGVLIDVNRYIGKIEKIGNVVKIGKIWNRQYLLHMFVFKIFQLNLTEM